MFWTEAKFEPKRDFRWEVKIESSSPWFKKNTNKLDSFFAKSVSKPSFSIEKKQYNLINRKINIPANPVWNDIEITFIDNNENKVFDFIMTYFYNMNVKYDSTNNTGLRYIGTTEKTKDFIFKIKQFNSEHEVLESWNLVNPVVLNYSHSNLNYESDTLSEYVLTVAYDWASIDDRDIFQEKINTLYQGNPVASTLPKVYSLDESITIE